MSAESPAEGSRTTTPFHDLAEFVAIPRVTALRLAPDGGWLAAAVQTLERGREEVPDQPVAGRHRGRAAAAADPVRRGRGQPAVPAGRVAAVHVQAARSRSRPGQQGRRRCRRPVAASPRRRRSEGRRRPARRGHGRRGGQGRRDRRAGLAGARRLRGVGAGSSRRGPRGDGTRTANTAADDARLRKERGDAGVTAILHESAPVRYWDHDLGPDQVRLFSVDPDQLQDQAGNAAGPRSSPGCVT